MLGMFEAFTPKFVKKYASIGQEIVQALTVIQGGCGTRAVSRPPSIAIRCRRPKSEKLQELLKRANRRDQERDQPWNCGFYAEIRKRTPFRLEVDHGAGALRDQGRTYPAVPDLAQAYRHALDHPIDAPPLRELVRPGERVTIAVSDITRVWQRNDLTLPILLETLNEAGVADENVTMWWQWADTASTPQMNTWRSAAGMSATA